MTQWEEADEIELPCHTIHHQGLLQIVEEYLGPRNYYLQSKIGAEDWELCQGFGHRPTLRIKKDGKINPSMLTFIQLKLK